MSNSGLYFDRKKNIYTLFNQHFVMKLQAGVFCFVSHVIVLLDGTPKPQFQVVVY